MPGLSRCRRASRPISGCGGVVFPDSRESGVKRCRDGWVVDRRRGRCCRRWVAARGAGKVRWCVVSSVAAAAVERESEEEWQTDGHGGGEESGIARKRRRSPPTVRLTAEAHLLRGCTVYCAVVLVDSSNSTPCRAVRHLALAGVRQARQQSSDYPSTTAQRCTSLVMRTDRLATRRCCRCC